MNKDLDVSRETLERLYQLRDLITKWTRKINLVAPNTVPDIWDRHIIDSAQIYDLSPKTWENWVDLGSGGGLPALVVAIMDPTQQPMTLIESDQRKCLFLNTVRRELSLNITVLNERIESVQVEKADVLSARALASLDDLLKHAEKLLSPTGTALFSKGERFQEELDQAYQSWDFDVITHVSRTNPASRILEISKVRRREH